MNNEKKPTLLVITCGTTSDPLIESIDNSKKVAREIQVVLWYGRDLEGQDKKKAQTKKSPFDVAGEVKRYCEDKGISVTTKEISDPEDFNICLNEFEKYFSGLNPDELEKLIINYTGGTKSMSAAIVHAAFKAYKGNNLLLYYVGGARGVNGRVVGEMKSIDFDTIIQEKEDRVIEMIKGYHYSEAREFMKGMSPSGRFALLFPAVEFLELIDNFNYKGAIDYKSRNKLDVLILAFKDNDKIKSICKIVDGLLKSIIDLNNLLRILEKIKFGSHLDDKDKENLKKNFPLLIADIYENAKRRLKLGDYSGSILRCYRAIEASAQYWEYINGIYPGDERWYEKLPEQLKKNLMTAKKLAEENIEKRITLEGKLSFMSGLVFVFGIVRGMGSFPEDFIKKIRKIQQKRNESFLEHGFVVNDKKSAEEIIEDSLYCIKEILGESINFEEYCMRIRHEW